MRWPLVLLRMIRSAVLPSKIRGCRRWSNHHNIAILNDLTTLYLPSPSAVGPLVRVAERSHNWLGFEGDRAFTPNSQRTIGDKKLRIYFFVVDSCGKLTIYALSEAVLELLISFDRTKNLGYPRLTWLIWKVLLYNRLRRFNQPICAQ